MVRRVVALETPHDVQALAEHLVALPSVSPNAAAGLGALTTLAAQRDTLNGSVLFVACPDEECESAGMRAAIAALPALRDREGLELLGALNLDYGTEPIGYAGVVGKLLLGVWVL